MPETEQERVTTITTVVKITDKQLKGLLCTAFEGGINSWGRLEDYIFPDGITFNDFRKGGKFQGKEYWHPVELIPLTDGCSVCLVTEKVDDRNEWGTVTEDEGDVQHLLLNRAKIEVGLQVMAECLPQHFQDFINKNDDANTGSAFIECCLWPDEVRRTKETVFA